MTPEAVRLLEAAGVRGVTQLSREKGEPLLKRMALVAWQRGLGQTGMPEKEMLEEWIREAAGMPPDGDEMDRQADDIPEAITEEGPGLWVPPGQRAALGASGGGRKEAGKEAEMAGREEPENPRQTWRTVDPQRFATIEDYNAGRIPIKPLSREPGGGVDDGDEDDDSGPERYRVEGPSGVLSRWVRRGVVHPRGIHTWLGAVVSVVFRVALLAGIVATVWLMITVETPGDYAMEVGIGAGVLVVLGLLQIHYAMRARCRICSCPLYFSKNCLKNRKAHLIPGFGYVVSAALHLLTFGWFRCMYCGTAVRLRPGHR